MQFDIKTSSSNPSWDFSVHTLAPPRHSVKATLQSGSGHRGVGTGGSFLALLQPLSYSLRLFLVPPGQGGGRSQRKLWLGCYLQGGHPCSRWEWFCGCWRFSPWYFSLPLLWPRWPTLTDWLSQPSPITPDGPQLASQFQGEGWILPWWSAMASPSVPCRCLPHHWLSYHKPHKPASHL